jgi:hypothetical protein
MPITQRHRPPQPMLRRRNSAAIRARRSIYCGLTVSMRGPPVATAITRLRWFSTSAISSSSVPLGMVRSLVGRRHAWMGLAKGPRFQNVSATDGPDQNRR